MSNSISIGHTPLIFLIDTIPDNEIISSTLKELSFNHLLTLDIIYPKSDTTLKLKTTLSSQVLREGEIIHEFKVESISMFLPEVIANPVTDELIIELVIRIIDGKLTEFN